MSTKSCSKQLGQRLAKAQLVSGLGWLGFRRLPWPLSWTRDEPPSPVACPMGVPTTGNWLGVGVRAGCPRAHLKPFFSRRVTANLSLDSENDSGPFANHTRGCALVIYEIPGTQFALNPKTYGLARVTIWQSACHSCHKTSKWAASRDIALSQSSNQITNNRRASQKPPLPHHVFQHDIKLISFSTPERKWKGKHF